MTTSAWELYPERTAPGLRNHFVYYLYDADGAVIYIGCTRNPEKRWREHGYQRPEMVAETVRCRMVGPYDFPTARRIEKREQYKHRPRHDARHPDKWSQLLTAAYAGRLA